MTMNGYDQHSLAAQAQRTATSGSPRPGGTTRGRQQTQEEANSTIDALMLGLHMTGTPAWRDNRATRRGGYRTQRTAESPLMPQRRFRDTVSWSEAELSTRQRNELPASGFALPGRRFPIPDETHARNALARASTLSPADQAKVKAAVRRRFPDINVA